MLARWRPDVVYTTGGYVAIPVLIAAATLRIPSLLWEGNLLAGRSVRATARLASAIAVSFPETAATLSRDALRDRHAHPRARAGAIGPPRGRACTSPPDAAGAARVRRLAGGAALQSRGGGRAADARRPRACAHPCHRRVRLRRGAAGTRPAAGGAARRATGRSRSCARRWPTRWSPPTCWWAAPAPRRSPRPPRIGLPVIVVPYPHAAAHQEANAREMVAAGAARLVPDEEFDADALVEAAALLARPAPRSTRCAPRAVALGRPGAARVTGDLLLALAERRPLPTADAIETVTRGRTGDHRDARRAV